MIADHLYRNKGFADTIRIIAHAPAPRVTRRYLDNSLNEIRICRTAKESRNADREYHTRDDDRFAEYMTEEEDDILREIQKALKVVDMYEIDGEMRNLIGRVGNEVSRVLALSVVDQGAEATNGAGTTRAGTGNNVG